MRNGLIPSDGEAWHKFERSQVSLPSVRDHPWHPHTYLSTGEPPKADGPPRDCDPQHSRSRWTLHRGLDELDSSDSGAGDPH